MAERRGTGRGFRLRAGRGRRARLAEREAVLVAHYRELARLAYLVLAGSGDRHHRVLAAHRIVQRSLAGPAGGRRAAVPIAPAAPIAPVVPVDGQVEVPDGSAAGFDGEAEVVAAVRGRVVRRALRVARGRGVGLPQVWGLRLYTEAGEAEALTVDQALARLSPAGRAACGLRLTAGLTETEVLGLLAAAGAPAPAGALAEAELLLTAHPEAGRVLNGSAEFDPCAVRAQPADLMRRRLRIRGSLTALGAAALAAVLLLPGTGTGTGAGTGPAHPLPPPPAAGPAALAAPVMAAPDAWRHTARLDFEVWPARGELRTDHALVDRARRAWATGLAGAEVAPGTPPGPPAGPPRLLYAGRVDGETVVLLQGEGRLARYTEGATTGPGLALARTDQADVTTAAAVVLHRTAAGARLLLAPWVDTAETRDLRRPDQPAAALPHPDGLTAPVPAGAADCAARQVLQLRSSPVVAEQHAFLLADLGGLLPVHLTYTPPPQAGPARAPREATGTDALLTWARTACTLTTAQPGTKAVNAWVFAEQPLPENAGPATWVCLRSDRWDGGGTAATELLPPGTAAPIRTAEAAESRACSRFDQNVLGATWWRARSGTAYLLVAGSRKVVAVTGAAGYPLPETRTDGHPLALPAHGPGPGPVRLTGRLDNGGQTATLG
ncbi:hypothetical protein CFP65_2526 [Kitasatospora sp. MMS16-BH015]|uniref:hypothetical protein n=1 Tax=Kitasatospora sp. MMS16-BH015 TaxID=2018025 RepID=UPI000CA0DE1E|nr:hypothetical protein [Kitasatospora sp. MMS16-BH015]AUG77355.1 hypothetical protein CFP65_2526 [Kitasatospora sp. MMS16-BH015]